MSTKKLNYTKLMELDPFIYSEQINSLGQRILFIEHPLEGDSVEVICAFPDLKLAYYSDFFELGEIDEISGEYEALIIDGNFCHGIN